MVCVCVCVFCLVYLIPTMFFVNFCACQIV